MKRPVALVAGAIIATILAAALWPGAEAADPQPPLRLAQANQVVDDEPEYSGVFACLGCHSAGEQTPYGDSLARVRLDEVLVWHREDTHSLAYCVLHGGLAKQMAALLNYNVAESKECLVCHAPRHDERSADPSAAPNYKLAEGVTCEDCHGASRGWHRLHVLKDQWQGKSSAEKKSHGMNDLRDPATRAGVCLDCHVGNEEQGQFVTHEMFAAGHPPLASIDVVAYADQMPRHWRTDDERAARGAPRAANDPFLATRQALAGNLLAGERALRLAARVYDDMPDFAVFDCDACHHELSSPSWRQARFARGVPGRPGYREWSLQAATWASNLTGDDATDAQVRDLTARIHAALRPAAFGNDQDQETTRETPLALAAVWKDQAERLTKQPLTQAQVDRLVVMLLEESLDPARPPDYDTARCLAWLLRTALIDLRAFDPNDASPAQIAWQLLDEQLGLSLPGRTGASTASGAVSITCAANPPQPMADSLTESLRQRATYDPRQFQTALSSFADAVRNGKTARAAAKARSR